MADLLDSDFSLAEKNTLYRCLDRLVEHKDDLFKFLGAHRGQVLPLANLHPLDQTLLMSRPLRLEFPGAIYHVTSRGDRREPIYRDNQDRLDHLAVLEQSMDRFDAQVLAYCLMGNHYHLVLHTRAANLSRLMRQLNGIYTQRFNRRHGLAGHLFQGRFKAILVDRDAYLLSLCRYVERNPVAAGLVKQPDAWPWSSCRAHLGQAPTPSWLDTDGLHGYLLGAPVKGPPDRGQAITLYAALLRNDSDRDLWAKGLRQQVFLGDEAFVSRMLAAAPAAARIDPEVPRAQRFHPKRLDELLAEGPTRETALYLAYKRHGFTMTRLAKEVGLSVSRVSRIISAIEEESRATGKT
jgi:REP element-mobilizing transposase RayT